jgi:hypothetical protein
MRRTPAQLSRAPLIAMRPILTDEPNPRSYIADLLGIDDAKIAEAEKALVRLGAEAVPELVAMLRDLPEEAILVRTLLGTGECGRRAVVALPEEGGPLVRTIVGAVQALDPPFVEGIPAFLRLIESGDCEQQKVVLNYFQFYLGRLLAGRLLAWAFVYFEKIGALHHPAVEALAQGLCQPEVTRRTASVSGICSGPVTATVGSRARSCARRRGGRSVGSR